MKRKRETVGNLVDLYGVDENRSASLLQNICWWWSISCCSWRRRFNVPRPPVTWDSMVTFGILSFFFAADNFAADGFAPGFANNIYTKVLHSHHIHSFISTY